LHTRLRWSNKTTRTPRELAFRLFAGQLLPFRLLVLTEYLRNLDEAVGCAGWTLLDALEAIIADLGVYAVTPVDSLDGFDRAS